MAIVVLLGIVNQWRQSDDARTLNTGPALKIVRHLGSTHQFTGLGVEVLLPEGWVYLSVVEDARSMAATFMHPASQSIVSLRANRLDVWPPKGHTAQEDVFAHVEMDWVSLKVPRMILLDQGLKKEDALPKSGIAWVDLDPRRLGRLVPPGGRTSESGQETRDLIMILVTHQHENELNPAVRELCDSIRFLGESG